MVAYKNFNIQVKGRVQDLGFRNLVENIARSLNLRGMVYNDVDGTVKIVCQGAVSSVKSLIEEIKDKSGNVGALIEEVRQEEIGGKIYLPPIFFKAPTDELGDISRKFDIGVESLQSIERSTHALIESSNSLVSGQGTLINRQEKLIGGQDVLIKCQETLVKGQGTLVRGQDRVIKLLEKIAEK